MSRYARQVQVASFGEAGQARLRGARVLVVGAGGLASPVLQYLAGAGVGLLRVVDPDRVEKSNLHRQTLFRAADLGQPKARAVAGHLSALNPETRVEPVVGALTPATVASQAEGVDIVIDCADSFAASYVLSDHCFDAGLPLISASAVGTGGYVGGFCGGAPSLRAVFPDLPSRGGSCAVDGVLGPVVGVLGALQAQMALAVLTRAEPSPLGRLVGFEARDFRFGGFRFDGAAEPAQRHRFLSADAIRDADFIVDLRRPGEGPLVHPLARRMPVGDLAERPAPGQRAVLCCRSGLRAWQAAEALGRDWDGEIVLVALGDP